MIRKLTLAVAVAAALSPVSVFALGLGDIHTQSALNQRFKAEIDLLSVPRDELPDLRVGLASSEAFNKAGIDRPLLLSGLRFEPAMTPDGRSVISVSSRDPVREPFLNFLLEVNWPKGRMVREYTVLLDPPVTLDRTPAPVQAPKVSAVPSRQQAPARQTGTAVVAGSYPAPPMQTSGARNYGPVQVNDNLWQIARNLRLPGESVEQVMMALQRYNPDAFIQNNVNGIKAGKILRLPADADVTGMSPRVARREFLAQTRDWRERQSQTPTTPADTGVPQSTPEQVNPPAQAIQPQDRLKLVSAKSVAAETTSEGSAEDVEKISRLEQEIMLVREENESAHQENEALQTRIKELEARIGDIQRLLTLKNDQLSELQAAQQIIAEKSEALAAKSEQPPLSQEPEPELVEPSMVEGESAPETPEEPAEVIEQVDIESIVTAAMQQEEAPAQPVATETGITEPVKTEPTITPPVAKPSPQTPPAAQAEPSEVATKPVTNQPEKGGLLDTLRGNSTLIAVVGGVLVLLLGMLGMIMRRRKEAEAEFAESILVTPEAEAAAGMASGAAGSINEPSEETSFMSDFSPSDIDALQDETGEVDPISEADVYIAYGRYQQAEELIKQAMERFPERDELKHKLLEIYYSAKNKEQFVKLSEELKQTGLETANPDVWSRIAAMGKELDPGNVLFAAAAGAVAGAALNSVENDLDDLDLDLDLSGELQPNDQAHVDATDASSTPDQDEFGALDLSELSSLDEMDSESLESSLSLDSEFLNKLETEEAPEANDTLEVDLGGLEDDSGTQAKLAEEDLDLSSTLDDISELSGLELTDNDLDETLEDGDVPDVIGIEDSDTLDDLDLESLEKELELLSGDLGDQPGEEAVSEASGLSEDLALDDEILDLDSTDEVTTKLDLARAYVDMGDAEGAKSILEEVVTEGSDDQKLEAQELLQSLAS